MSDEPRNIMTPEELDGAIVDLLYAEAWASALRAQIQKCLEAGISFQNAYLEPKNTNRKWAKPDPDIIRMLQASFKGLGKPSTLDDVAPRTVVTPAAAEKTMGKTKFADLMAGTTMKPPSSGFNLKLRE